MSDDDPAQELIDSVLNTTDKTTLGGNDLIVKDGSPIDVLKLAQLFAGSLIALVYAGVFGIYESVVELVSTPWRAAGSFGSDVFDELGTQISEVGTSAADATGSAVSELPLGLSWPAAVAVVLVSLYIAVRGFRVITDG